VAFHAHAVIVRGAVDSFRKLDASRSEDR